jgi:DNA-binding response OmpR family regulator
MISKILFVEDTIALANIVKQELQTAGFSVLHTASGREALRLHADEKPDLVILDWMLPDIDGLNVLRTIRQNAATPVIMVTAKSEEIDKILGLEIGADDYITKPFSVRELVARIHAIERRIESVNLHWRKTEIRRKRPSRWTACGWTRPTTRCASTQKRSRSAAPNSPCCTCS